MKLEDGILHPFKESSTSKLHKCEPEENILSLFFGGGVSIGRLSYILDLPCCETHQCEVTHLNLINRKAKAICEKKIKKRKYKTKEKGNGS